MASIASIAQVWDSLREGGLHSYELLACASEDAVIRMVGNDLKEVAMKEREIGATVLDLKRT